MSDQAQAIVDGLKILFDALQTIADFTNNSASIIAQQALEDYEQATRNL
jgi:predicted transcriptional regulator